MGGFWRSAVSALANCAVSECCGASGTTTGFRVVGVEESATVWQAWQLGQDSHWPSVDAELSSWLACGAPPQSCTPWPAWAVV